MAQQIMKLMENFSFDTRTQIVESQHEARRYPRAKNGLLSAVWCNGSQLESQGITSDFSLSGLQLRLPLGSNISAGSALTLEIMTPYDSLEEYQRQQPLRVEARVVWGRRDSMNAIYGLEFEKLNSAQQDRLEACFAYFGKNPRFQRAD